MKKAKENIQVVELASHELTDYNEDKVPGKNIKLHGPYNSYYKTVDKAFRVSPTNACVIQNIQQQMYGKGLAATDVDEDSTEWEAIMELLPAEDLMKICYDYGKFTSCVIQVGYNSEHTEIIKTSHLPVETIGKGMKNNKGEIISYYYCADWEKSNYLKITKIPAFGTSREKVELIFIGKYSSGMHYFNNVEYESALPHAYSEGEMASFIINKISKGFAPTLMLNFNNGVPTVEKQQIIKNKIKKQYEGTDGDNLIISFQESSEQASTIDSVPIPDPYQQFDWVSTEATKKILMAHRIVSPILVGIKDNTGFGNNAEELKSAYQLHNATLIRPKQDPILEALKEILKFNGVDYDIYFETIMPIAFTDVEDVEVDEEVEKETGVDSETPSTSEGNQDVELSEVDLDWEWSSLLNSLAEEAPEGYIIDRVEDVGDEPEDVNYESLLNELELAAVESAPIKKSSEDSPIYKVRYRYKKVLHKSNQRDFCRQVHALSGQNKFFRKEDIGFMSAKGVNRSFGHNGRNYSIWKYKGGVNCGDIWERVVFRKKLKKDGEPYLGNPLQNTYRSNEKAAGLDPLPAVVTTPPYEMPNHGRYPS